MKTISVKQFCTSYKIPQHFIDSLSTFELINIVEIDATNHILIDDISKIEQLMRMHFDLNVNLEGLDVINNLLNQIFALKDQVKLLENRLKFYE